MNSTLSQTPEQLTEEIEFWREFIHWWEQERGCPAGQRALQALAAAEQRYEALMKSREGDCAVVCLARIRQH